MNSLQPLRSKKFVIPLAVLFAISALFYELRGTEQALDWVPLYAHGSNSLTSTSSLTVMPMCPSLDEISSPVEVLPQEGLQCHSVDSALSEFTVDACYNPQRCGAIDLVLRRTDEKRCSEMEEKPGQLNEDPTLNFWMREQVGPDAFFLQTDGPERKAIWSPTTYTRGCEYTYSVRLSNGGPFQVQMWWHYDDWEAWNETNYEWPKLHEMPVFSHPLEVDFCSECSTTVISHPADKTLLLSPSMNHSQTLPNCVASGKRLGAYLPTPILEHPAPRYRWVGDCVWNHAGLRYVDHQKCLQPERPVKFLFVGDSHARVTFDGIRHRMEGNRDLMPDSEKTGHKHASFPGLDSQFSWDPISEGASNYECKDIEGVTHIIVSIGQHMQFFSSLDYYARVRKTLSHLSALPESCGFTPFQHKLFLPGPSEVPRNDTFPREFKDRASNLRLMNWARIGIDMAIEEEWDWVDAFKYSSPFVHETPDMSHYYMTDALDAIIDDVIGVMGFCDY